MSSELQRVRELRPEVAPPTPQTRQAALQRLMAGLEDEAPGLHAHRAPRARQPEPRGPVRRARRTVPRLGRLGALVPIGVVAVAAAVVVGALVLLGHHASRTPVDSATGDGRI